MNTYRTLSGYCSLAILAFAAIGIMRPVTVSAQNGWILDPADFTSLGTINSGTAALTFDTTSGSLSGGLSGSGVISNTPSGQSVMVFTFSSIDLQTSPTLTGTNPIAILSQGNFTLNTSVLANGGNGGHRDHGLGVLGGFDGGDSIRDSGDSGFTGVDGKGDGNSPGATSNGNDTSGGAGYGGAGGAADLAAGSTYGVERLDDLIGGSGAGASYNKGGGAGGGAIELVASGALLIDAAGSVSVNGGSGAGSGGQLTSGGGSGGAILLSGNNVTIDGTVQANGGNGGDASGGQANGGGGGGGRIAVYSANPITVNGTVTAAKGVAVNGDGTGQDGNDGTVYYEAPTLDYSMQITYTNFVGRGTLTNFPVLVKLNMDNTDNYAGFLDTTDGYDLRFWTNSALSGTELNYEIESFDANGTSYIWVQVPAFTQNRSIWASWGDPDNITQQAYTTNGAVWSEGFAAVWHLSNVSLDSSTNAFTASDSGTVSDSGVISSARDFENDEGDSIDLSCQGVDILPAVNSPVTLSCWFKPESIDASSNQDRMINIHDGTPSSGLILGVGQGNKLQYYHDDGSGGTIDSDGLISAGNWYYGAVTYNGSDYALYLDGAPQAGAATSDGLNAGSTYNSKLGTYDGAGEWYDGVLDEARISTTARSSNWVWASYMNQGTNHGSFVEYGTINVSGVDGILWSSEATSDITSTSAVANATVNTNLTDALLVWEEASTAPTPGTSSTNQWAHTLGLGAQSSGTVTGQISGLTLDTEYVWRIYGESDTTNAWSSATSFATDLSDAEAPTFTNAVGSFSVTGSEVTLGWNDNSDTETEFVLLRSANGVDFTVVATPAVNSVSYTDTVPDAGTYTYRLAATNATNNSSSDPALCETNATISLPVFGVTQTLPVTSASASSWPYQVQEPNSVLVVGNYDDPGGATSMSFGGQSADGIMTDDRGALAYFLNPSTNSGLSITANSTGFFAAWVLSGVDLTATPDSSFTDTITTSGDGMYIASWAYANFSPTLSPGGSSVLDQPIDMPSQYAGNGEGTGAGGSALAGAAGSYNVGWDSDGDGSPLAYAFAKRPPSLVNLAATNITSTSAVFHATLETSASAVDAVVYWGTSNGETNAAAWATNATVGSWAYVDSTNISFTATNLNSGTQYYYTFRATNATEDAWASPSATFLTDASAGDISIVNVAADSIVDDTARLNANLAAPGADAYVDAYWWITGDAITNSAPVGFWNDVSSTNINYTASGLQPNTDYSFTFRATNSTDDILADPALSFTTLGPPAVTNTGATRVGAAKARLNGMVTATNGTALTHVRIYFGANDPGPWAAGWDTNIQFTASAISTGVVFHTDVFDLAGESSYNYRVYASNIFGDVWSDVDTFTTEPAGTVTLDDSGVFNGDGSFTASEIPGFDPSGADKLVVTISAENDEPTEVKYGGEVMTLAVQRVNTIRRTWIWYLDDPGSAGELVISPASSLGGSMLALSGTRAGVGPTNMTETFTASLTTELDNTFVVASYVENNAGSATVAPPFTSVFAGDVGSGYGASGYYNISNALTLVSATFGNNDDDSATVVAGFAGVTPPGQISFTGLAASPVSPTEEDLTATLLGSDAAVSAFWDTNTVSDPATHTGWVGSDGPVAATTGGVARSATSLSPDTVYHYAFYGSNSTYSTDNWSAPDAFISAFSSAQAPTLTSATQVPDVLQVALTWHDNADNETAYLLYRSVDGGAYALRDTLASDTVSHTDTVAAAGDYAYRLAVTNATNGSGTDPALADSGTVSVSAPEDGVIQVLQVTDDMTSPMVQPFEVSQADSVLVVAMYVDTGPPGAAPTFNNVRFGNDGSINQAVDGLISSGRGALAYFLDPSTETNLAIRVDGNADGFLAGWVLAGIDLDAPVVSSTSNTITTTAQETYILSWAYNNSSGTTISPSGSSVIGAPLDIAWRYAGSGTGTGAGGSTFRFLPGTYNVSWDSDNSGSPLAFAFAKVPETTILMFK